MIIKLADMDEAVVIVFRKTAQNSTSPTFFNFDENNCPVNYESAIWGKAMGDPITGLLFALENYESFLEKKQFSRS